MKLAAGNTHRKIIDSLIMAIALLGSGLALAQDKHIDVSVVPVGDGHKMQFTNSECPQKPNQKGCILALHGSSPNISWELDRDSNSDWVFTGLQLSPDGVHWGDPAYPLEDCTMEDFSLNPADRQSGEASSAQIVANGRRLKIRDRNINPCVTHYLLTAESTSSGEEIDSDPIIENRGGGPR